MTLSSAKVAADGATMDSPGGGRFLLDFGAAEPKRFDSEGLTESGPSPLADFCRRDSIMERCWSLTEILLCSCSLMLGSCVWNPGDRHARPTSCMASPSRAVNGPLAVAGPWLLATDDRSSFCGRCLLGPVCMLGDGGDSFLIDIFGAGPPLLRDLV